MKYFPKLPGEKVYLSPMCLDDAEAFTEWFNDLGTSRFLTLASAQITLHGEREHLVALSKGQVYSIIERGTDRLLGNCGLVEIDQTSRSAEVGIFIGPADARGKGYGTEALRLLCDYAFNALGIHSIMLRVYAYNTRAIASYRKAGFKELGRRRQAHFYAGAYHDIIMMDLLAEEFGPSALPPARC